MEKKLRAKLEDELREYREAANMDERRRRDSGGTYEAMEELEDIRRQLSEADEKVRQQFF